MRSFIVTSAFFVSFVGISFGDDVKASPEVVRAAFLGVKEDLLALPSEESGLSDRARLALKGVSGEVLKKHKEKGRERQREIIARRAETDRKIRELEKKIADLKVLRTRLEVEERLPKAIDPATVAREFYEAIKKGGTEERFDENLSRAGRSPY